LSYRVIEIGPATLDVSVVIPIKDEADNVGPLAAELDAAMAQAAFSWECVWVDDGSTDRTGPELARIAAPGAAHRFVTLDRNYGQSAALAVGFCAGRGRVFVTLDGDGQNDPADVPALARRVLAGEADVVNGWRERRNDTLVRKLSSRIANGFRNWVTDEHVRDVGCSIRAFRREAVRHLFVFRGMHRFLPTLFRLNGCGRMLEVPVNHRPRARGKTKYGIHNRLWVGLADAFAIRWMMHRLADPRVREAQAATRREEVRA
jgi:dolichol-phosphate mannosyltransferase